MGRAGPAVTDGLVPEGWRRSTGQASPGNCSILAESCRDPQREVFVARGWKDISASAPARFSTWEGYAGRNQRNGAGFSLQVVGERSVTVVILV